MLGRRLELERANFEARCTDVFKQSIPPPHATKPMVSFRGWDALSPADKLEHRLSEIKLKMPMHKEKLHGEFNSLLLSLVQASENFSFNELERIIMSKKQDFLDLNAALVTERLQSISEAFGYEVIINFDEDLVIV